MNKDNNISNLSEDTGPGEPLVLEKEEILSRKYFLKGKTIGISISESDNLLELGYGVSHLKDVMIEIAKYVLASGGKIAYGGDMRQGGFTELIFDLLAYYKADNNLKPNERFYNYLAYPISTTLSKEKEAELRQNVSFKKVDPPEELVIADKNIFLKPNSPENLYIWSRCLTEMREEMESKCHARIFIGGRIQGYKGKSPGILEEMLIAIRYNHPVYLIGAFGGVTRQIIDALNNKQTGSLFINDYHKQNHDYREMFEIYNEKHKEKIDYPTFFNTIKEVSIKGISDSNGLTDDENIRLFTTPHINEIVYLVLKGLTNCFVK